MAHPVSIHNSVLELDLEVVGDLHADSEAVQNLYETLHGFAIGQRAIKEVAMVSASMVGTVETYDYRAEAEDGTELVGTIRFPDATGTDPFMNITVPGWARSVLCAHNLVLDAIVTIRSKYGLVSLEVVFS